jgi:ATP-dependent Clp protease ATP-binding subunit ClpA
MKTTKNKNIPELKLACPFLNRILTIRKLTNAQLKSLINDLKTFIRNSKPGNIDVFRYVKLVVLQVLTLDEKKAVTKFLAQFEKDVPGGIAAIQNTLTAIYNTIVEVYPELRIESICSELNGFDQIVSGRHEPPTDVNDEQFQEQLEKSVKRKSKVKPVGLFNLSDILDLEDFLRENLIGQDEAVHTVCDALMLKVAGFTKTANLFFIGKTGRGKSQLAKLLADKYSSHFWQIDCAEFSHGHEMNKLLGAPPGYIGFSGKSLMKEKADKSNKWVILFDEIEKANEKFFNFLLGLTETGMCHDTTGNKIDFSESIFIFTSNVGTKELKTRSTNFHNIQNGSSTKEELLKSLEHQFSPEFRNRIDEFVFFNDLTREDVIKIAELNLREYPIKATPELINFIVDKGFSEEFGARAIKRCIKRELLIPLSKAILSNKKPQDGSNKFEISVHNDHLEIVI